jgi:hypothetical protein
MMNFVEAWVRSGGAGIGGRLTTAAGHSKHLAALDEVVDGSVDLCREGNLGQHAHRVVASPFRLSPAEVSLVRHLEPSLYK